MGTGGAAALSSGLNTFIWMTAKDSSRENTSPLDESITSIIYPHRSSELKDIKLSQNSGNSHLPSEVVGYIAEIHAQDDWSAAIRYYCSICKFWRTAVRAAPPAWAHFKVEYPYRSDFSEFVTFWIGRAKNALKTIRGRWNNDIQRLLDHGCPTLEVLMIDYADFPYPCSPMIHQFQQLKHFSIKENKCPELVEILSSVPTLISLSLQGSVALALPQSNEQTLSLQHLRVRGVDIDDVARLVQKCSTSLLSLVIRDCWPALEDRPEVISTPNLDRLWYSCDFTLSIFAPKIKIVYTNTKVHFQSDSLPSVQELVFLSPKAGIFEGRETKFPKVTRLGLATTRVRAIEGLFTLDRWKSMPLVTEILVCYGDPKYKPVLQNCIHRCPLPEDVRVEFVSSFNPMRQLMLPVCHRLE